MDLGVSVEVAHTLDVHYNQLMARTLKCEVAEGLWGGRKKRVVPRDQVVGYVDTGQPLFWGLEHSSSAQVGGFLHKDLRKEKKKKTEALFNSPGTSGTQALWPFLGLLIESHYRISF